MAGMIPGNAFNALSYALAQKNLKAGLLTKADLVNGKVPSTELPSYVSTIVEVASYNNLPNPGSEDTIYVTLDTGFSYRWTGTTYIEVSQASGYISVSVKNMQDMGALRNYINGINTQVPPLHCFFDFSEYIQDAYICTVLMFAKNDRNYCMIFDVINGRTFIDYAGYDDATSVQDYVDRNQDDLIRTIKITDPLTTVADVNSTLSSINVIGHHVFFDVSALNAGAYLCSVYLTNEVMRVFDLVTQTSVSLPYDGTMLLTTLLGRLSNVATEELLRLFPAPMTTAELNHLKDDGWYCAWSTDQNGHWHMTVSATASGTYNFPYQSSGVLYIPTDDPYFADAMATISEAKELLEGTEMVTPEQYAELERQGLLGDKHWQIVSPDLYNFLTVTIPAQEEAREENEDERQDALRDLLRRYPWPITTAEIEHIMEDGYYCNWTYSNGTWTMAVSQTASGDYSFPYQDDVYYPDSDEYDLSDVVTDIAALQIAVAGKLGSITGWTTDNQHGTVAYTGDFTAKTLSQTEANDVFNFSYRTHPDGTITDSYSRGEVINGIMWLIGNFTLTSSGSATVSVLGQLDMVLPTAVAEAVWDFDGTQASTVTSEAIITSIPCVAALNSQSGQGASNYVDCVCEIANTTTANKITITVMPKVALSMAQDDTVSPMFRVPLTLI